MRRLHINSLALAAAVCLAARGADGAEAEQGGTDLFQAMQSGQVVVKFIPTDAAKANVLIENATDRVLHIELPEAIAAVPVLAQFDQGRIGQNVGGPGGGGSNQAVGGGLNAGNLNQGQRFGGGNNFGMNGIQNGFMRIEPEKTRKLTARTVCLEHGKPDPHPRITYRMIPIDQFTDDPKVAELCGELGRGNITQKTAQAAAWHLTGHLSWKQLADINQLESKYRGNVKFFQRDEIDDAREFVKSLSAAKENRANRYVSKQ